jgi:hypothetical protein
MEDYLRIAGDGLSIASLAIIYATSFNAHKRIRDEARVPLGFDRRGEPSMRTSKLIALWGLPVLSVVLLFLPTVTLATYTMEGDEAIMLLALRALVSSALAFRHIIHVQRALDLMGREGQLRS